MGEGDLPAVALYASNSRMREMGVSKDEIRCHFKGTLPRLVSNFWKRLLSALGRVCWGWEAGMQLWSGSYIWNTMSHLGHHAAKKHRVGKGAKEDSQNDQRAGHLP